MTLEELQAVVAATINGTACSAEFYFLLRTVNGFEVKRPDIDQNAQTELGRKFIDSLRTTIVSNSSATLVGLSGADERQHAVYQYDLEEIPVQLEKLTEVLESDDFETFDFRQNDLEQLAGILVLIGDHERQVALYKHQYPITLLKKDSGFSLKKMGGNNRFEKLDSDILRISSNFEFMKVDGRYYIIDLKALEKFFGFHQAVKNVAQNGIQRIRESALLLDPSVLQLRLDDISFSRKLVRASRNSPVLGVVPPEDVISFIQSHPALRGRIAVDESGTKLDLKTKVSQDLFLKLLNDDFLQSELTKKYYASLAKDAVGIVETLS